MNASFWDERYREGRAGWDIGEPAPPFVEFLQEQDAPSFGKIVVPGSGNGHDALFFAAKGFEVTGFDFAPSAVSTSQKRAKEMGLSHQINFVQQDIFKLPNPYKGSFDFAVEHTCFCAIDPGLREDYVHAIHSLLKPGGMLVAVFYTHGREGGPPFSTSANEVTQLFSTKFEIKRLHPPKRSHHQRAGEELFGLLHAKPL
ncbi:MAG: methyltransferase domain-containing protein [Chloroflexi bacterium]|uniref:Methyltransferase domain-containing protein n=1 Tax=Candidatus Chlorohelix allophototropha TaxID=3003348 RepID=A0A8T7M8R0_9CHLR|nr:methyltransferase domain-containing protein [Chloroflexota bacterium]WJW68378.1 TPMT family class I SAM-dependent methyltransferase [Chloroflexota bacterium L227-S17]